MAGKSGYEREILTHLKYIRAAQETNQKNIVKLFEKVEQFPEKMNAQAILYDKRINAQAILYDKRFDKINSEISKAKGFLAGVIFISGIVGAAVGYSLQWIGKILK